MSCRNLLGLQERRSTPTAVAGLVKWLNSPRSQLKQLHHVGFGVSWLSGAATHLTKEGRKKVEVKEVVQLGAARSKLARVMICFCNPAFSVRLPLNQLSQCTPLNLPGFAQSPDAGCSMEISVQCNSKDAHPLPPFWNDGSEKAAPEIAIIFHMFGNSNGLHFLNKLRH